MSPETKLGRYRLVRRLGQGGMAETFEAVARHAAGIERRVCVKRILPRYAADPRFERMFIDEARVSMTLRHGNIAQVYDFGRADGGLYLAMELVDGRSLSLLRRRLSKCGYRFPLPAALEVTIALCRALHHAHTATDERGRPLGIVHRDVSPQNVLLSFDGQIKLVDFGIARAAQTVEIGSGLKGKLPYMAPEQAARRPVDARADVFGAGAVLFELLAGRPPLPLEAAAALEALSSGRIPRLGEVAPQIDPDLAALVDQALAARPEDRFQSALDFERALANYAHARALLTRETEVGALLRWAFADPPRSELRLEDAPPSWRAHLLPQGGSAVAAGASARRRRRAAATAVLVGTAVLLGGTLAWIRGGTAPSRTLQVRSLPTGAEVWLDGVDTGVRTNGRLENLEAGRRHRITFRLPGFEPETVEVGPNDAVAVARLRLASPTRPPPPGEADGAPPAAEAAPRHPQQPPPAAASEAPGGPARSGGAEGGKGRSAAGARSLPPLRIEAQGPGHFIAEVSSRAAFVDARHLPFAWVKLGGPGPFTAVVQGDVDLFVGRPLKRALVLGADGAGRVVTSRLLTVGRPWRVPTGVATLGIGTLELGTCLNNTGAWRLRVRGPGRTRTVRAGGRTECFSPPPRLGVEVGGLAVTRGYRVRHLGGPPVLVVGSAGSLLGAQLGPDAAFARLEEGQQATFAYYGALRIFRFEGPIEDAGGDAGAGDGAIRLELREFALDARGSRAGTRRQAPADAPH
ncbi:MAG: PEGA domain-containing protein [Deltaproteobacteria bacterium]|nr:MAG: PEGA domain-containing protein [Deltaproteobacteria bacterium]